MYYICSVSVKHRNRIILCLPTIKASNKLSLLYGCFLQSMQYNYELNWTKTQMLESIS